MILLHIVTICSVSAVDVMMTQWSTHGRLNESTPRKVDTMSDLTLNLQNWNESFVRFNWMSDVDVKFWLYTRFPKVLPYGGNTDNPDEYEVLKINDSSSLINSNFDLKKRVKLVVHGWITNGTSFTPEVIKSAYLSAIDVNVIILDWSNVASYKYIFASYYVNTVGSTLTEFLKFLVDEGVKTDDIHLIGHSLGAHVVGIAGKYYYDQRKPINAITGLDPAYPLYKYANDGWRLDRSDARHVQVVHTCAGYLGYPTPMGHVDYYPNGGTSQPGCGIDLIGTCAHDRAVIYFAVSIISSVPLTAVRCENYDQLYKFGYCNDTNSERLNMSGLNLHYGKEGVYYLKTTSDIPFALRSPNNWNGLWCERKLTVAVGNANSWLVPGLTTLSATYQRRHERCKTRSD